MCPSLLVLTPRPRAPLRQHWDKSACPREQQSSRRLAGQDICCTANLTPACKVFHSLQVQGCPAPGLHSLFTFDWFCKQRLPNDLTSMLTGYAVLCYDVWVVCAVQGERGHAFYIVESGQLSAFKDNSPLPVLSYGPGTPACLV